MVPNEPLRLLVDTAGFNAASVDVEFRGVDMNMGLIRNELMTPAAGLSLAMRCCRSASADAYELAGHRSRTR